MPTAPSTTSSQDENSGLHDIKAMAQSTRARNSRRITAQAVDEDVLASSAAGLRAVALPDPSLSSASVSMPSISMPSPDMSPTGVPSRPSGRMAASTNAPYLPGALPTGAVAELAALARPAVEPPSRSKAPLVIGGVALLAAAGAVAAYVATRPSAPATAPTPDPSPPPAPRTPTTETRPSTPCPNKSHPEQRAPLRTQTKSPSAQTP